MINSEDQEFVCSSLVNEKIVDALKPGECLFYGDPVYVKAHIDSQQWRDMLAAAVREFDRKQVVCIAERISAGCFDPAELRCPVCGLVVTQRLHEWRSGMEIESTDNGYLIAWQRNPSISKFTFQCLCGARTECEISYE